jgi:hypothetical protein
VDQTGERCIIDATNMYFEGPIYDTAEKWIEYYAFTKKMKTSFVPEDMALKGINFMNLHNIVVDRENKARYTTVCVAMIEEALISEFV